MVGFRYLSSSTTDTRKKGPRTPVAPELSDYLRQVIVGLMLGDLNAERTSINGNTRLRVHISAVHKAYGFYLYDLFMPYINTAPKEIVRKWNPLTQQSSISLVFSTLRYAQFNWVFSDFYQIDSNSFIKIIPLNIYESLTAIGLAFWIMDDGSFSKINGNLILCTDSFTLQEVQLLISVLTNKFNLSCGLINYKINSKGDLTYRIRINKKSLPTLIELVKPHFIDSMLYKLGLES